MISDFMEFVLNFASGKDFTIEKVLLLLSS